MVWQQGMHLKKKIKMVADAYPGKTRDSATHHTNTPPAADSYH